eukprot:273828-Chlamydomonas_euryale.AAC.13
MWRAHRRACCLCPPASWALVPVCSDHSAAMRCAECLHAYECPGEKATIALPVHQPNVKRSRWADA